MRSISDSLNREVDFEDLSPKMQGLVAASIKCAAFELLEVLPDEPEYKESPMKKILSTIARQFKSEPCPLEGIQPMQSQIRAAYEDRLGTGSRRSRGLAASFLASTPKVKAIR